MPLMPGMLMSIKTTEGFSCGKRGERGFGVFMHADAFETIRAANPLGSKCPRAGASSSTMETVMFTGFTLARTRLERLSSVFTIRRR